MLLRLLIISFGLICSCQSVLTEKNSIAYSGFTEKSITLTGYSKKEFKQDDTLAWITIKVPSRLDTFYQWTHFSDCANCGEVKYRFADGKYNQLAENGWYWYFVPDSVYQFSIWHKPYKIVPDSITYSPLNLSDSSYYYSNLPYEHFLLGGKVSFRKKEFRRINSKDFFLCSFVSPYGYLTQKQTLYYIASTRLRNRSLSFIAECSARDSSTFFDEMYKTILSIRIDEN